MCLIFFALQRITADLRHRKTCGMYCNQKHKKILSQSDFIDFPLLITIEKEFRMELISTWRRTYYLSEGRHYQYDIVHNEHAYKHELHPK